MQKELLLNALNAASMDPILNLKIGVKESPGNKCKWLSDVILAYSGQFGAFDILCRDTVGPIILIMTSTSLKKNESQDNLWHKVHKFIVSTTGKSVWETFLSNFIPMNSMKNVQHSVHCLNSL